MGTPPDARFSHDDLRAAHILAERLAAGEVGTAELDELCQRHPALAGDLLRLFAEWQILAGMPLRPANRPVADALKSLHGEGVDPGIELVRDDPAISPQQDQVTAELYRRLRSRARSARYAVRDEVGSGGMGVVFRVWDEELRRNLAMKVLLTPDEVRRKETPKENSERIRRFLEEAQITAQLDHPGIVAVHELGLTIDHRLYFTMKLVKGRNLKEIFALVEQRAEGWNLERALGVILKICETLAFAHDRGVIHRDIKPTNVMVGRFGETYVMDWGLAHVANQQRASHRPDDTDVSQLHTLRTDEESHDSPMATRTGRVMGTPAYMSPEQASGRIDDLGPRSDVYSVGALLYQLLTSVSPYGRRQGEDDHRSILTMVIEGPPRPVRELRPEVPEELEYVCERAMARNPGRRYASTMEMAADIEAWLGKRPMVSKPPTFPYVLRLYVARNKTAVAMVAAAAALLIGLTAWFIWSLGRANRVGERFGDLMSARALLQEEDDLRPLLPDERPRAELWLSRAQTLLQRSDDYRREAEAVATPAEPLTRADLAEILANTLRLQTLVRRVQADVAAGAALAEHSIDGAGVRAAWDVALTDLAKDERFAALPLQPQLGLVPLLKNQLTGLWEFWHVESGQRPEPTPDKPGSWLLTEATGIVLVLLPGGRFVEGASPGDAMAEPNEEPSEVELPPFFFAKYEVTQAQWQRIMGRNPAQKCAGIVEGAVRYSGLHPVESISWNDAMRFCARLGLLLPTEAQFEFANRAGSTTPWHWGANASDLQGKENILDQSYGRAGGIEVAAWDDCFPYHAPIGSFAPNAFGLFDTTGNVSEWCFDLEAPAGPAAADSRAPVVEYRRLRGGNWGLPLPRTRVSYRMWQDSRYLDKWLGLRTVRAWDAR